MSEIVPIRGRVYRADLGAGPKPWLVVSNNARNRALNDVLVVRITTSVKPPLASIVELEAGEPLVGRVLCDDLGPMYRDEIIGDLGALSNQTMVKVATALRHVLAL
ncbi:MULTISPECIES: type II toxin-antitoxin system PemK/MazF family toxin [unclassified Streptomyces]|uniref:type II toxin-antitoxin system PemK/MazF family toxin n=1 Tax=unclassified Streptomyces TaxID=2593676 RepID=UPI000899FDE5|nr:type II toxin-antitoxin system PemK/MazF family toxin [Streptomyces sp. 2131.1]WSX92588.1 type II toxin-antitoxin system PemK/MazF family toxin [Streptomyces sp. NBC_00891]WSY07065.1 type II toxin-antitoxin system PemK/MazF family toxin [Streptomyces sp. NBC_00890]WSZ08692.1 type II toxin-antitoxin system PemK/MazF family toxin [Streptomyces sp. NBC_00869]WSZ23810.1 type II toxin-antitoxin system PemK/MazF family toxin [Streptomyces sp. NBC_00870]SEC90666.1 mRNA interferase MazF [Streptomyc